MDTEEIKIVSVPMHRIILHMDDVDDLIKDIKCLKKAAIRQSLIIMRTRPIGDYGRQLALYVVGSYPRVYKFLKTLHRKYDFEVCFLSLMV